MISGSHNWPNGGSKNRWASVLTLTATRTTTGLLEMPWKLTLTICATALLTNILLRRITARVHKIRFTETIVGKTGIRDALVSAEAWCLTIRATTPVATVVPPFRIWVSEIRIGITRITKVRVPIEARIATLAVRADAPTRNTLFHWTNVPKTGI